MTDETPKRQMLHITPISESWEEKWGLREFVDLLNDILVQVPEGIDGYVSFTAQGDYETGGSFIVGYERPETDEEMAKRVAEKQQYEEKHRLAREAGERRQYEALKAKFEPG